MRLNTLKGQVETVLRNHSESRNSDITLMIQIWRTFYPQRIKKGSTSEEGVWLKDIYDLPREDGVKRLRAHFQNDRGLYLPTSWQVAKQRKINEKTWRDYMGAAGLMSGNSAYEK